MTDSLTSLVERLEPDLWSLPLVHYSRKPLRCVRSIPQPLKPDHKPRGLWISVENGEGWREWCEAEEYGLSSLASVTDITLSPAADILWLRSCDEIDWFTKKYGRTLAHIVNYNMIDWQWVAKEFQGIVIAPYQWDRRFTRHTPWYYSWDCASGCIWDKKAISALRARQQGEADG